MIINVLEYLEIQSEKNPNKIAVEMVDGKNITFNELMLRAKECGSFIADKGVIKSAVPVFSNQSIDSLILFFGVLYSGNYYVPIDVDTPIDRVDTILSNCNAQISLGCLDNFSGYTKDIPYYGICNIKRDIDEGVLQRIRSQHTSSDPLYMVYTSGSTGVPKGVIKSHNSMINFIESFVDTFELKDETIGNQTPFYFDASNKDIYLMLKLGATLYILQKEMFMFPVNLINYLNEKKITYICWVPSALSIVSQLNAFKMVKPEHIRNVFFVGEVMPIKHLNNWRANVNARYVNLYGSSEIAGICTYYEIKREFGLEEKLPIGKALKGVEVFLLNEENKLVKDTENIGEVCVRGPILASGYYGDKEKTEKIFVNNPIKPEYLDVILKTGDLGKYDEDGNIVYISRKDFQIKHMGHRIELSEIEIFTNALDIVDSSCCLYDTKRNKIVLFFTQKEECEDFNKEITLKLKKKLPDYMIPNRFIKLEEMPKNKNGKIDRNLLKQKL